MLASHIVGDGPRVVLLHGIPGSAAIWHAVVADLGADYQTIVPDLLGFGSSPRPTRADDLAAPSQARALAATLDGIGGPAVLVGHDFGGPVALTLAARRPELVAGVVLVASNTFGDTPIPFPLSTLTWPGLGGAAERLLLSGPSLSVMVRRGGVRRPAAYLGDRGQRRAIRLIFADALRNLEERYAPVERSLRSLQVPVAVLWGDEDPFFGVAQAHRTAEAAGVEARILAGAGHFLPKERPAEIAQTIRSVAAAAAVDAPT